MLSARNVEPKAQKKVNEDLERVCGWCGKSMGVVSGSGTGQTHGICQSCKSDALAGKESPEMVAYRQKKAAERSSKPPQNESLNLTAAFKASRRLSKSQCT